MIVWFPVVWSFHPQQQFAEFPASGGPDLAEFFAKVIVEPAVEEWVGAGRTHARHVAHGVDDEHCFRITAERVERIVHHIAASTMWHS